MTHEAQATALRFFQEQDRRRGGPPDELCAKGYSAHLAGLSPMDLHGHQAFAAAFYGAFPDLTHHVEEVVAENGRVAVRFRLTGTNTESFMGRPASGKPIDVGAIAFLKVVGGKVMEIRGEFDQLHLLQQIGALPRDPVSEEQVTSETHRPPRAYWLLSDLALVHVTGEESDQRYSVVEFLMPPNDMTPLHLHQHDSQTIYVLEGEVTIHLPGVTRVLRRGECIYQPAGVPQTERVTSDGPARVLDINSPAGFERFIAAVGQPTDRLTLPPPAHAAPDIDRLSAVAAQHGITLLGPPGTLP